MAMTRRVNLVTVLCALRFLAQAQSSPTPLADLREAAEKGDAVSQFNLGVRYSSGQGVVKNYTEALTWYRKAADHGYADAQYNIGVMYDRGQGVPKDYAEAVRWYRMAADQGDPGAQFAVGAMYDQGHGVRQDCAEAVHWYRKAVEQGSDRGPSQLAEIYFGGCPGLPPNYTEAAIWYRKAADQGDNYAKWRLGTMYSLGLGVPQNYSYALRLFRELAKNDDVDALHKPRGSVRRRQRRSAGLC